MNATSTPRVKICCISSIEEASLAIECGASALGLVSSMPSGPGVITDEQIDQLVDRLALALDDVTPALREAAGS